MKADKIIAAITRMRERADLNRIIDAAEARDSHLGSIESVRKSKLVFGAYQNLKKGDQVFVHVQQEHGAHKVLFGQALAVLAVQPKNRALKVSYKEPTGPSAVFGSGPRVARVTVLRWSVLDRLKVSTEPTPAALASILRKGE